MAYHLSRIVSLEDSVPLQEYFHDEQLLVVGTSVPWYADLVNYLVTKRMPVGLSQSQRHRLRKQARHYVWDEPYLWKHCADQVIRRCVPKVEQGSILKFCHEYACRSEERRVGKECSS